MVALGATVQPLTQAEMVRHIDLTKREAFGLVQACLKVEPPTDAAITAVVQKISRRVIRTLRHLGYLETGRDGAMPTGLDPFRDDAPELARTLAASVQQRIAFGERAGQQVRRISAGFGAEGEAPTLTGTRCASVQGFSLHAKHAGPRPSARPVGAPDPLYCPRRAVRPCVLSHPVSQLLAQQQPLRRVAACASGLKPSHCNSPRRLNQSSPSLRGLRGELSERLAACQAASRALAGTRDGTRWRGKKSTFKILILCLET